MMLPEWILVFVATAAITALLVALARALAIRIGAFDRPVEGTHKVHGTPTPLLGGVAVALGTASGALVADAMGESVPSGVLISGAVALLVGLVDDLRRDGLSPAPKLLGQIAASTLAVTMLGTPGWLGFPPVDAVLVVVALVLITNAFNLIDNVNGLCAGTGALAALALVAWSAFVDTSTAVALPLAAACLAFLPFNFPRARLFLGDAGSHAIGHLIGVLALLLPSPACPGVHTISVLLVTGLPFADVAWVVAIRTREGRSILIGDRTHLSHTLLQIGRSLPQAVGALWGVAGLLATLSVLAIASGRFGIAALLGGVGGAATLGWLRRLAYLRALERSQGDA